MVVRAEDHLIPQKKTDQDNKLFRPPSGEMLMVSLSLFSLPEVESSPTDESSLSLYHHSSSSSFSYFSTHSGFMTFMMMKAVFLRAYADVRELGFHCRVIYNHLMIRIDCISTDPWISACLPCSLRGQ